MSDTPAPEAAKPKNLWPQEKMDRWITVHADAGFKDGRGRGAFAARAAYPPLHLRQASDLGKVESVQEAEAIALLMGAKASIDLWGPVVKGGIGGFFLRSDAKSVTDALAGRGRLKGHAGKVVQEIQALARAYKFELHAKHVPGHAKDNTKATYMNNLCDAKSNLRGK